MDNKAKSVTEVIELIKSKFSSLRDENEIQNLWFRAEKINIITPLIPTSYRERDGKGDEDVYYERKEIEGDLKASFSRYSKMFISHNRIPDNEWNNYFLMQHYGAETRLLDWTESALVSIYFAVENDLKKDDFKIWILNPYRLNKSTTKLINGFKNGFSGIYFPQSSKKDFLFDTDNKLNFDELHRKYLKMDFDLKEESYPLAIYPYLFDERMKAQKACFTIFGNQINGLLDNSDRDKFLQSIVIDGKAKNDIKKELSWLGISKESVYPGLDSVCKDIQEKFRYID